MQQRFAAQLLSGRRARTPEEVTDRLLAVQAQDPRGMRLAIRARSTGLRAADVDEALNARRSLVVSWLNRGTLHLVRREDFWWLHELTTPQLLTSCSRRLRQEGVSAEAAERGVDAIARSVTGGAALTRQQLRERISAEGVRTEGQALPHLLFLATLRGLIVRGPMVGAEHAFVSAKDWVGAPPVIDRDAALACLGRRYLAGHGPATAEDLARWAGLRLGDARRAIESVDGLLRRDDGLVDLPGRRRTASTPPPRLLGAFDPVLLGWTSRESIVGAHHDLVTSNGVFRPFALVGGRAAAKWRLVDGRVEVTQFDDLDPDDSAALAKDATAVTRFLAVRPGRDARAK
jgi:hypothetical protein